jgi:hypothetical protein
MAEPPAKRPPRRPYLVPLVTNALTDPFNVGVLAAMLVAGLLLHHIVIVLPIALVVYGLAAARTLFDDKAQNRVIERQKSRRRSLEAPRVRLDPSTLDPPLRRLVEAAHDRDARIREAIDRAQLPYTEVLDEVDGFIATIEQTAGRAQLLSEALRDNPPAAIESRLAAAQAAGPEKAELAEALTEQLTVQRRVETQLGKVEDRMERMLIELDTVRGQLISVSASTDQENQERLAGEVRSLRQEMGTVAEGLATAYDDRAS